MFQAIQSSPEGRLTLAQIYDWMIASVAYFLKTFIVIYLLSRNIYTQMSIMHIGNIASKLGGLLWAESRLNQLCGMEGQMKCSKLSYH